MGVADFLFNGSPPPSVNTYGTTTTNVPQWMSDYTQGLLSQANAVAAQPYQPYTGPRIADFTPDQQSSMAYIRGDVGSYQPMINDATIDTQAVRNNNPLNTAMPFLNNSAQSSANVVGNYLNPYNDAVTNRIGQLAARNLSENLLPAIGDNFTRAGQYGSSRMQEITGRALRDTQESALAQQAQTLQQGYNNSLNAAQQDLSRQGQIGQTVGNLGNANNANLINAGTAQSNIANSGQKMYLADAAALSGIGQQQQNLTQQNYDTAYQDFINQRDYPKTQVNFMDQIIRGLPVQSTVQNTVDNKPTTATTGSGLSNLVGGLTLANSLSNLGG